MGRTCGLSLIAIVGPRVLRGIVVCCFTDDPLLLLLTLTLPLPLLHLSEISCEERFRTWEEERWKLTGEGRAADRT